MGDALIHGLLEDHGNDTLEHAYASKYYDPVKAHEYYERTKQLKGRQPATTQNQAIGLKYANNQIQTARDKALTDLTAKREATIAKIQAQVKATRERIEQKLKEKITARTDAYLKRLENLPEDASPELVARLAQMHSKNVRKAREETRNEMQKVSKAFSDAFKKARDEYTKNRASTIQRFNTDAAIEERNIRARVR
jgi:hypothetical protein